MVKATIRILSQQALWVRAKYVHSFNKYSAKPYNVPGVIWNVVDIKQNNLESSAFKDLTVWQGRDTSMCSVLQVSLFTRQPTCWHRLLEHDPVMLRSGHSLIQQDGEKTKKFYSTWHWLAVWNFMEQQSGISCWADGCAKTQSYAKRKSL